MRGKEYGLNPQKGGVRITPAYAGKSNCQKHRKNCWRDHPRLCGEKMQFCSVRLRALGSPPPMRGKDICRYGLITSQGITPAYAGKSRKLWTSDRSPEDHPRLCGEKLNCRRIEHHDEGSPPPMRGKVPFCQMFTKFHRITPAYAGKSRQLHHTSP